MYNQEGALVIAKNPRPRAVTPADLPEELRETIEDARRWVRQGAVTELASLATGTERRLALAARAALIQLANNDDSITIRNAAQDALNAAGEPPRALPLDVPAKPRAVKPVPNEPAAKTSAVEPALAIAGSITGVLAGLGTAWFYLKLAEQARSASRTPADSPPPTPPQTAT